MKMAKSVEEYIESHEKYAKALSILRKIMLTTEMQETLKWGIPTYTINDKNVLNLTAFNNYFGIWFINGVYLTDANKILINAQEGITKAMRQLRFTNFEDINKSIILDYTKEAIENQKKGLEFKPQKKPLLIPKKLGSLLDENTKLATIFESLTLTEKREFTEYISSAKRDDTKQKRLEKIIPMILNNIGLNDKYK